MAFRYSRFLLLTGVVLPWLIACQPDNDDPISHVGTARSTLSLALSASQLQLAVGQSQALQTTVSGRAANGAGADDVVVSWLSSDSDVAQVSADGTVLALSSGTATITASAEQASASVALTVTDAVLVGLSLVPPSVDMAPCSSVDVDVFGQYSDGSAQVLETQVTAASDDDAVIGWQASDVTSGMLVSGVAGSAVVTVSAEGMSAALPALVSDTLVGLSLDTLPAWLGLDDTLPLAAEASYSDGSGSSVRSQAAWSVTDVPPTATLSVLDDGASRLEPTAVGPVTLQVDCGGFSATTLIQVVDTAGLDSLVPLVDGQVLSMDDAVDIAPDTALTISVLSRDDSGLLVDVGADVEASLSGDDAASFQIDPTPDGSVQVSVDAAMVYEQQATLVLTHGADSLQFGLVANRGVARTLESVAFLVADALGNVSEMTSGSARYLQVGDTLDLSLLLRYTLDSETLTGDTLFWSNADPSVVTVDGQGRLVAVSAGSSEVAVLQDGQVYTLGITVVAP